MKKKFLIDVWDWDPPPFSHDLMGYLEVSLEDLIQKAQCGAPLALNPPPQPHKQLVGCLYVETAVLALPQVHVRASSTRAAGLKFKNMTSIALKVRASNHAAEFDGASLGSAFTVKEADDRILELKAKTSEEMAREVDPSKSTYIMILSLDMIVLGKFCLGSYVPGSKNMKYELHLELESGNWFERTADGAISPSMQPSAEQHGTRDQDGDLDGVAPILSQCAEHVYKEFALTMTLKLRGSNLLVMDSQMGGENEKCRKSRV